MFTGCMAFHSLVYGFILRCISLTSGDVYRFKPLLVYFNPHVYREFNHAYRNKQPIISLSLI